MAQINDSTTSLSKNSKRSTNIKVLLLDNNILTVVLSLRDLGQVLFDEVIKRLQIIEYDYFGIEYQVKENNFVWLDYEKEISKQIPKIGNLYQFSVKFYTPHPNLLEDEYTRYLYTLQIKRDLFSPSFICNENTAALLGGFIVQAEIGDYIDGIYNDTSYIRGINIFKNESEAFLLKVKECHKNLLGKTPADADFNLLDTVRKVEMYGLRLKLAKDSDGNNIQLAVCHSSINVFKRGLKIDSYSWARIRKLCFKKKTFILKLHPDNAINKEFHFDSRDDCKHFWKQCIEHHAFFRCHAINKSVKSRKSSTKGSSFMYTGRTQKQLLEQVRKDLSTSETKFERSASTGRMVARVRSSLPPLSRLSSGGIANGIMTDVGAFQTNSRRYSGALAAGYTSTPSVRTSEQIRRTMRNQSTALSANSEAMTLSSSRMSPSRAASSNSITFDRDRILLNQTNAMSSSSILRETSPQAIRGGGYEERPVGDETGTQQKQNYAGYYLTTMPDANKKAVLLPINPYSSMHASLLSNNQLKSSSEAKGDPQSIPAIVKPLPIKQPVYQIVNRTNNQPQQAMKNQANQIQGRVVYLDPNTGQLLIPAYSTPMVNNNNAGTLMRAKSPTNSNQPIVMMRLNQQQQQQIYLANGCNNQIRLLGSNNGQNIVIPSSANGNLSQNNLHLTLQSQLQGEVNNTTLYRNNIQKMNSDSPMDSACDSEVSVSNQTKMLNLCQSPKVSSEEGCPYSSDAGVQMRQKKVCPPPPERRDSISSKNHYDTSSLNRNTTQAKSSPKTNPFTELTYDISKMEMIEDPEEAEGPVSQNSHEEQFIRSHGPSLFSGTSCLSLAASRHSLAMNLDDEAEEEKQASDVDSQSSCKECSHLNQPGCVSGLRRANSKPDLLTELKAKVTMHDFPVHSYATLGNRKSTTQAKLNGMHTIGCSGFTKKAEVKEVKKSATTAPNKTDKRNVPRSMTNNMNGTSASDENLPYHIIRNLVMSERSYKRDLNLICSTFKKAFPLSNNNNNDDPNSSNIPSSWLKLLFSLLSPIYNLHSNFLSDLESRLSVWDTSSSLLMKNSRNNSSTTPSNTSPATTPNSDNSGKNSTNDIDCIKGSTNNGSSFGDIFGQSRREHHASSMNLMYRVGDLFVANLKMLPMYRSYMLDLECLMLDLERILNLRPKVRQKLKDFESNKTCYITFYALLLKPMHRLIAYRTTLEALMRNYTDGYIDMQDCRVAHVRLLDVIQSQWDVYKRCENLYKLIEIQRNLTHLTPVAVDSKNNESDVDKSTPLGPLVCMGGRQFIREGWLQKLTKKGYQPRMFFLFSDQLVYASRVAGNQLKFKVHGQFHLSELVLEESDAAHSFTVYCSGNRCFLVAANNDWTRDRWLEDCSRAILAVNAGISLITPTLTYIYSVTKNSPLSKEFLNSSKPLFEENDEGQTTEANQQSLVLKATTSLHVCWQRNLTYSMTDVLRMNECENSGYLLRKFKNSNGWQKLWVVFTHLCLFFHKSFSDDTPLASLPLLGYTISLPDPTTDPIKRPNVFKLQFKNHVYYFRGDSEHSFKRWYDCLSSAITNCSPNRSTLNNRSNAQMNKKLE